MKPYVFLLFLLGFYGVFRAQQRRASAFEKLNNLYLDGVYHYITAEYERSEAELTQCLRYGDTVGAVYYYLALNRLARQQTDAARRFLDSACRVQPGLAETFPRSFRQVQGQLRKENTPQVTATTPSGQKIGPAAASGMSRETFLQTAQEMTPSERWEMGRKLTERFPFDARLVYVTAKAGTETGHWDEAARLLENGMDFASTDSKLYRKYLELLVRIYEHTGRQAKANHYRKLLQKH